jgi:eukaryotic-like serine/threonine-protein kinase
MAEVYRAKDTRLGRDVAIKVVSEALGGDEAFLERFDREAKLAASVAHPNVVALHDVGFHDGKPYFVTELLQGESLRERLAKGPVPMAKALEWAAQMANGLAAAQEHGIVHRDLKPENVFLTRNGHVKLLDFGIAKLVEAAQSATPHGLMEPTVSPSGGSTGTGMVLGTPGYMSPEQVRGDPIDARTDFFSLGAVLYEMLTGHRAFPAGSVVESGYAILHNEPEPLPAGIPVPIGQVVNRCLEKDPARRFDSARDLAFNLELLRAPTGGTFLDPSAGLASVQGIPWRRWGGAIALAALGTVGGAWLSRHFTPPLRPPSAYQITYSASTISNARFAPDGRVIFSARVDGAPSEIFARSPGNFESQPLGLHEMSLLAVSPTGELAVALRPTRHVVAGSGRATLALVSGPGATPRPVAEGVEFADFSPTGGLAVVRVSGAKRRVEYPLGKSLFETTGYIPDLRVSPTGDAVAFINRPLFGPDEVVLVDERGDVHTLSKDAVGLGGLVWTPDGKEVLFTTNADAIWSQARAGPPRLIYQNVGDIRVQDISKSGTVLVVLGDPRNEVAVLLPGQKAERRLSPFDYGELAALSRDGKSVLLSTNARYLPGTGGGDIAFLRSTDGSPPVRLGHGVPLAFSPDLKWALIRPDGSSDHLLRVPFGPGEPKAVSVGGLEVLNARWLTDGQRFIALGRATGDSELALYVLSLTDTPPRKISGALSTPYLEVSLDDRIAAARNLEGVVTLYAVDGGPPIPIPEVGDEAVPAGWSSDGNLWMQKLQDIPSHLLLFDFHNRRILEERVVGPSDLAGINVIWNIKITPDARTLAFEYHRQVGYLFLMDGLLGQH